MVMSTDISQLMFMSNDNGHLNGYVNWY